MRLSSLVGTGLLLAIISASGAMAQNSRPDIALATSSYGGMSCSKFVGMPPGDRDAIVRKMVAMAPASSLAATNVTSDVEPSGEIILQQNEPNLPPLDSGRLVSACQATNSGSTLREAYARSNVAPDIYVPTSN